ncbi:hypothetical protein [Roseateles terrae]|uniref:Uncharacterized protein n=1 Tax=Roseateles terrae TaxID=431060 RepID=A0ABR6GQQ6_9BURK|nr:hypothetical protein [Roseateles terrae]MBB3193498.1 hypothetical protein [Roseateles terrae]
MFGMPRSARRWLIGVCGVMLMAHSSAQTLAGCGSLANNYGPHDYRDWKDLPPIDPVTKEMSPLQLVEGAHFIDTCEALFKCKRGSIGADLDYTLRAFPNHHRALVAMMRYGELTRKSQPPDARYTVDCYFRRALVWRPEDAIARLLYATYLNENKRVADAKVQLQQAARQTGDNPFTVYNLGMVALDLNEVDMAVDAARRSYAAGMKHPALRQRLQAMNRWPSDLVLPEDGASAPVGAPSPATPAAPAAPAAPPAGAAPSAASDAASEAKGAAPKSQAPSASSAAAMSAALGAASAPARASLA